MSTALYPATAACDERMSIDCARVVRGTSSSAKSVAPGAGDGLHQLGPGERRHGTHHDLPLAQPRQVGARGIAPHHVHLHHHVGGKHVVARTDARPAIGEGRVGVAGERRLLPTRSRCRIPALVSCGSAVGESATRVSPARSSLGTPMTIRGVSFSAINVSGSPPGPAPLARATGELGGHAGGHSGDVGVHDTAWPRGCQRHFGEVKWPRMPRPRPRCTAATGPGGAPMAPGVRGPKPLGSGLKGSALAQRRFSRNCAHRIVEVLARHHTADQQCGHPAPFAGTPVIPAWCAQCVESSTTGTKCTVLHRLPAHRSVEPHASVRRPQAPPSRRCRGRHASRHP